MGNRYLQLTNKNIGAVAVGEFIPLGNITGRINCPYKQCCPISVSTSKNDTIVIGNKGHYIVNYNSTLVAGSAGIVSASLVINGTAVYTQALTVGSGANGSITFSYEFKVPESNVPTNVQIELGGVAITNGVSNLIIKGVNV